MRAVAPEPGTGGLVGRGSALAAAGAALDAAAGGRGRLVLVSGEPGIGKTALAGAVAARAAGEGALVLWGQCWEGDGAPAYWPWVQVLRAGMAAGGEPGPAAALLPEDRPPPPAAAESTAAQPAPGEDRPPPPAAAASTAAQPAPGEDRPPPPAAAASTAAPPAPAVPDWPAGPPPAAADSPAARFRLFDATVGFLTGLAARRTVVIVLDDLQWADEGSLRLLDFASRHVAAAPVLLLGAYRDEEAGETLRRLAASSEQVALPGLPRRDVASLMAAVAGAAPGEAAAADVWRRTGGNPFLVRELTRLLLAQGDYSTGAVPLAGLLGTVGDILGRRLARLSQPCADLLTVAAVCGPEVRAEVLARVTGDAEAVPGLLDEAVAARVLEEAAPPFGPYRFSHDLFRETLVAGLPSDDRRALHLAAARALEARRDEGAAVHVAELAAHFAAAATAAPGEAVRYAVLAAEDAASRLAFEEACRHYERALAALDLRPDPDPAARLDLLLKLGDARSRAGATAAAHDAYGAAAALARRLGDGTGLALAAMGVHGLGWRDSHAESITLLEEAEPALSEAASLLRARVLAALARDLHHAFREQDWERAPVLAEEAVAVARGLDDPATLAFCLLALHDARWRPGTARQRLPVIEAMLAAAEGAGDRDMEAQGRLLRATALIELGDPAGISDLEVYCHTAEELGHAQARYGSLSRRATAALLAGRLPEAEQLAEEAYSLGEAIDVADALGVRETLRWGVARAEGGWPCWATVRHDADGTPTFSLDSDPWAGSPLADAVVHLAAGDVHAARRVLGRLRLDALPRTSDLEMLTFTAEVVAAAGSDDQRAMVRDLMRPYAGSHVVVGGCASYFGAVDHYLGLVDRSLGLLDEARRHFEEAAALEERLGAPAWVTRSRAEAGACTGAGAGSEGAGSEGTATEGAGPQGAGPQGAGTEGAVTDGAAARRTVRTAGATAEAVFRREGEVWTVGYRGREAHLPDAKGLRDVAVLLARPHQAVHAVELHTGRPPRTGADAVLDDAAKAAYRRRLLELEADVDEAEADHDPHRADGARAERDALLAELSVAVGLGGRDRRLGDERERARKAVTARIREAIGRIGRVTPELAEHLGRSVQTGTWCSYAPVEPVRWDL